MALIDVHCLSCGTRAEVYRAAADWPKTPACDKCGEATEQIHLPAGSSITAPAVVVYKAPDGTFRFPGDPDPNSRTNKQYAKLGYERVEHRGWAEVRRLEGQVGKIQASEIRRRVERQCAAHEAGVSQRRSEIRRGFDQGFQIPETDSKGRQTGRMKTVRLSPHGRDLMQAAMAKYDAKPGPKSWDSGFHVGAYSDNRSNRDDSRAADGRRHRD